MSTLQLIVENIIRVHFDSETNDDRQIPSDLKQLITKFASKFVPSSLTSMKEDIQLMQKLLYGKAYLFENKSIEMIFKASKDGYSYYIIQEFATF